MDRIWFDDAKIQFFGLRRSRVKPAMKGGRTDERLWFACGERLGHTDFTDDTDFLFACGKNV
jgi:hypothetical protein